MSTNKQLEKAAVDMNNALAEIRKTTKQRATARLDTYHAVLDTVTIGSEADETVFFKKIGWDTDAKKSARSECRSVWAVHAVYPAIKELAHKAIDSKAKDNPVADKKPDVVCRKIITMTKKAGGKVPTLKAVTGVYADSATTAKENAAKKKAEEARRAKDVRIALKEAIDNAIAINDALTAKQQVKGLGKIKDAIEALKK